jgi:DNA-binding transcriptional LysR family regulator
VELREIETFLVLAEELHFGRSATRLHLSQSRVSQTIRSIESRIGGRLFDRTSRQVRLTLLGELLRDRSDPLSTRSGTASRRSARSPPESPASSGSAC